MTTKGILSGALVAFLLFPFLFLFSEFSNLAKPDLAEFLWAFKNSLLQAGFSALFSVSLGLLMALGLTSFSSQSNWKARRFFEISCLLPNFLPPLFILLAVLNAVDGFPMGLVGIIFIHTLMNAGLVAVLLASVIEQKLTGLDELSYVEGASRWNFFIKGLVPVIRQDILFAALFVFTVCFSSFSVPLIVGGGRGTTLEVLIYEKMRLSNDWGGAVVLAFFQSAFIFILALFLKRSPVSFSMKTSALRLARLRFGVLPILFILILFLFGYLEGIFIGENVISQFYGLQSAILHAILGSLVIGFLIGGLTLGLLILIAYCWPQIWLEKFLNSYVAPSTALACFGLLIVLPNESIYPFLKIPLAFLMLNLTGLHRLGWETQLDRLRGQYEVAKVLGAHSALIFKKVLLPQIIERAGLLAGLAAVWGCGDFAISRVLAHRDLTLAMMTETLMSSYRLHQASVLSLGLILVSLFMFFFFIGVTYVLRRKLMS